MSHYTHRVSVISVRPSVGEVTDEYRTTSDAVELHRTALQKRYDEHSILSFTITELPRAPFVDVWHETAYGVTMPFSRAVRVF